VIDGRAHKSTLYLNPRIERRETMMFGPGLTPGEPAARATGMDAVLARDEFGTNLTGRTIYCPFRPEVLGSASASDPTNLWKANKADPWDERSSREEAFIEHLKKASPQSEVKNLDPVLDKMRGTKSASEIALLREATQMTGRAIVEAMRDARPGMYEYELQADAEFVFKKFGAYGPSYFALVATGQNTFYSHYHRGTAKLQDGDLVQFDYAPDYKNYSSDVTRVFPANGKFTAWQAEYYTIYLRLYQALMSSIEVHKTTQQIMKAAVPKMDAIVSSYKFTDPRIKDAATKFVDRYRNSRATSLGHTVGMEVHDVAYPTATLEPGQLFTIEPAMQIPELHLGIRLEDMLMMTDTGYENLSAFVPIEIRDIEKTMHHHGLSDAMAKDKENR
jgi:Xaa-Pro aminopeptidase